MIKIRESIPIKLSGNSSLFISFDKNFDKILPIIKSYTPAIYSSKNKVWELSTIYLVDILENLYYYDNIELELSEEEVKEENNLSQEEIRGFKYAPYKHQIEAINFLINNKKALLLDSMGVGKSLEIMYTAEVLHKRGLIEHCLIVCGVDSLRSNWKNEILKFSKESVLVIGERINKNNKIVYTSIPKRVEQLKNKIDEFFIITNISSLRDDNIINAIKTGPNKIGMIAVDEIHKVATKTSQQGNNLLKLKTDYQIAATGSPITNSPLSIYIPLSWTDSDKSNLTNYKNLYCEMEQGPFHNQQIIGYKNLLFLQDEIHKHSIRRTFNQIRDNMPKKTIEYELVEMSDEHRKFYEDIKNGVKEEADKIELNINNLLALTTRLRQATSIPNLLTSQNISSSKIERCVDIAESVLNNKEKLVIFCNFIESANELYKLLSKYNPILGTGQQDDNYISEGIEKFRNSDNYNLLICTHSKMGTGFSFPECHYALMLDTPFTYSQFSQSCDRIYRITSEQPVYIKVLACKDTYDERVRNIIENKKDLGDFLIDKKDINIINELKNSIINL